MPRVETLAIIAYHQPVTRAEIEEIRGVAISKGTLDSLLEADWIKPEGRRETPGRPVTWATTHGLPGAFQSGKLRGVAGFRRTARRRLLDARSTISTLGTQGSTVQPGPEGHKSRPMNEACRGDRIARRDAIRGT